MKLNLFNMFSPKNNTKENLKIEIREINDISGNNYLIFDLMSKISSDLWKSRCTYFSLEDVLEFHPDVTIVDKRSI